jgi:hypothetical protein
MISKIIRPLSFFRRLRGFSSSLSQSETVVVMRRLFTIGYLACPGRGQLRTHTKNEALKATVAGVIVLSVFLSLVNIPNPVLAVTSAGVRESFSVATACPASRSHSSVVLNIIGALHTVLSSCCTSKFMGCEDVNVNLAFPPGSFGQVTVRPPATGIANVCGGEFCQMYCGWSDAAGVGGESLLDTAAISTIATSMTPSIAYMTNLTFIVSPRPKGGRLYHV